MLKFFRLPFATTGDKTAVPNAVDSNGNVSYSQGYGFDYQRQKTDPAAKNIERDKMNQIFFDMTTAIAELQSQGVPDFITTALNGGTAYSYAQYAVVKYSGDLYISLVAANTALPSDATKWALLPTPARIQAAYNSSAVATGTADALLGAFAPAIAALPAAPGTLSVFVRAGAANTTTTPTFKADGTTAKTIVKGANQALVAGDIAGAGHWLELQYDATLDKWILQNPAYGVSTPPTASIVGASKNLVVKNNTTTPASKLDATADEIVVKDASGSPVLLTALTQTVDITVNGANGLDTGAAASNTWYYLWAIWNGTTKALLLSASSTAPTMPGGYTHKALISAVYRTTVFRNFVQAQDYIQAAEAWQTLSGGTATAITSVSAVAFIPPIHKVVTVNLSHNTPASVGQSIGTIYSGNAAGKVMGAVAPYSAGNAQTDSNTIAFLPEVAQTYYYSVSSGSSSHTVIGFQI